MTNVNNSEGIFSQVVSAATSYYNSASAEVGRLSGLAVKSLEDASTTVVAKVSDASTTVAAKVSEYEPIGAIIAGGAGLAITAKAGYDIYNGERSIKKVAIAAIGAGVTAAVVGFKAQQYFNTESN